MNQQVKRIPNGKSAFLIKGGGMGGVAIQNLPCFLKPSGHSDDNNGTDSLKAVVGKLNELCVQQDILDTFIGCPLFSFGYLP